MKMLDHPNIGTVQNSMLLVALICCNVYRLDVERHCNVVSVQSLDCKA